MKQRRTTKWREYMRAYARRRDSEYMRAHRKRYHRSLAGRLVASLARGRRRARCNGGSLTIRQWKDILDQQRHMCAYCGWLFTETTPPTRDHVYPLSRGGLHDVSNIVAACLRCNRGKRDKLPDTFMPVPPVRLSEQLR